MSRRSWARAVLFAAAVTGGVKVLTLIGAATFFGFDMDPVSTVDDTIVQASVPDSLRAEVTRLRRRLADAAPRGTYVVIDRANNRLWVRKGGTVLHEAVVSTGSRTVLEEAGGQQRRWTFDTPPGRFRIRSTRKNPVWVKPDWAFLEEGQQPPTRLGDRVERGSLGEWALDLGDGYMIHGTLYERLLGRSLTHGCVRVGRDDLRVVAGAAKPGTTVYIF